MYGILMERAVQTTHLFCVSVRNLCNVLNSSKLTVPLLSLSWILRVADK